MLWECYGNIVMVCHPKWECFGNQIEIFLQCKIRTGIFWEYSVKEPKQQYVNNLTQDRVNPCNVRTLLNA